MKAKLLAILLLALAALDSTDARAGDVIKIKGTLEFWTRACDAELRCELPASMAAPIAVEGEIPRPVGDDLKRFEFVTRHEHLEARLQVYWRIYGDQPHQHYLSAQMRLIDLKSNTIITECSHYDRDDFVTYFPVGACSGTLKGVGVGVTQQKYNIK